MIQPGPLELDLAGAAWNGPGELENDPNSCWRSMVRPGPARLLTQKHSGMIQIDPKSSLRSMLLPGLVRNRPKIVLVQHDSVEHANPEGWRYRKN